MYTLIVVCKDQCITVPKKKEDQCINN